MRLAARLLLISAAAAGAGLTGSAQTQPKPKDKAPGDPAPLLKAVTPPAGGVRVRLPAAAGVVGGHEVLFHIAGEVPKARKKKTDKAETVPVTIRLDTVDFRARVAEKKWTSWGYDVPKDGLSVLPELILPASQVAPKALKGRDVRVRVPAVPVRVVATQRDVDTIYGCDLTLPAQLLDKVADRGTETRLYFADKLVEFTAPAAAVTRPGGDAEPPADPKVTADPALVPAANLPADAKDSPFVSVNGKTRYKLPTGGEQAVFYTVDYNLNWPQGVVLPIGTALGCGVEFDENKELASVSDTALKGTMCAGTVKELRLGLVTGPGLKAPKDLVLKDVPVVVSKNDSGHGVWLGGKFVDAYFTDAVYATGPDGLRRLYGRVKPDLLFDVKTRAAAPPPKKP